MAAIAAAFAVMYGNLGAAENSGFFTVPDFTELPPAIEVVSEKTEDGVKVTEMYFSGAPFAGKPTRIYGFYCRPEKAGRYPAVLDIHGAGIEYAKAGFCSFVMDWAGPVPGRVKAELPTSKFEVAGNMARIMKDAQGNDDKAGYPPYGWKTYGPEGDGIRNGVLFARRAAMFLKSRPEVDTEKLCVTGPKKTVKVSFWVKRMPKAIFWFGGGDSKKPETMVKWIEVPATDAGGDWTAEIAAPGADEQVVAYAMATDVSGVQASSDTVELPDYPQWRRTQDGSTESGKR